MKPTKAERDAKREEKRMKEAFEDVRVKVDRVVNTAPIALAPVEIIEWHDCYSLGWRDLITPESFSHPAKAGRILLQRIFDHLFTLGMLERDIVCDPFGGIGTTGLIGAYRNLRVISCELEPKFVALARDNFLLNSHKLLEFRRPLPIIVQGDSRQLRQHVQSYITLCQLDGADAVISSPPYSDVPVSTNEHGGDQINRARLDESLARKARGEKGVGLSDNTNLRYGNEDGQLGAMPTGDVDAVVTSPPYISGGHHTTAWNLDETTLNNETRNARVAQARGVDPSTVDDDYGANHDYGKTLGQMGGMLQGDVDAVVSSPPYEEIATGAGGLNTKPAADGQQGGRSANSPSQQADSRYGKTDGQLAKMEKGGVDAVVSSPPYAETLLNDDQRQAGKGEKLRWGTNEEYGTSPGQLGVLKEENGVSAVVTSPPFGSGDSASAQSISTRTDKSAEWVKANCGSAATMGYGDSQGQMAQMPMTETFWGAARDIVRECHALLKPGGYAVWIVKAFVRDKQIVDFPGDWRKLCEHCGFETLTEVHAMLVKQTEYVNLYGDQQVDKKERKSFFRRLAEAKGSPKIDYEVVWIMRKRT